MGKKGAKRNDKRRSNKTNKAFEVYNRSIGADYTITEKDVDEIIQALEQEPCEDCISRQAVLEAIEDNYGNTNACCFASHYDMECFKSIINELPPIQPKQTKSCYKMCDRWQRMGQWIDTGSGQECSECGEIQYGYDSFRKYCANCGAKMSEIPTGSEGSEEE